VTVLGLLVLWRLHLLDGRDNQSVVGAGGAAAATARIATLLAQSQI
jgi:hypothetical protein